MGRHSLFRQRHPAMEAHLGNMQGLELRLQHGQTVACFGGGWRVNEGIFQLVVFLLKFCKTRLMLCVGEAGVAFEETSEGFFNRNPRAAFERGKGSRNEVLSSWGFEKRYI